MSVLAIAGRLWLFFSGRVESSSSRIELERVRSRDPKALEEFFDRHFPRIYALSCRLLGRREEAEDLTQEVLFRVHGAVDRLDPDRDPVPWLMTITYNACRDYWRSRAVRAAARTVSIDADPTESGFLTDPPQGPEEERQRATREAAVQAALMRLPEASRVTVLLHDYQGLGHEAIGETLGISAAAARKRYSRALHDLSCILRESMK